MSFNITTRQRGFSMIEVMISLFIIAVGLLGLASLQSKAQVAELEAYQRAQALLILTDIVDTMHANRLTATCFRITTDRASGTPFIGNGYDSAATPPTCTVSTSAYNTLAVAALTRLDGLLDGSAETISGSGSQVGAMIGARACISYNSDAYNAVSNTGGELANNSGATITGTGEYTIAVVWQGMVDLFDLSDTASTTIAPALNCAVGQFGDNKKRRMVSMKVRLAVLN